MNSGTNKATFTKSGTTYAERLEIGGAASADARALLPWTGSIRPSSERRAIVRTAHPEWSPEYVELVVSQGDQP